MIVGLTGGIGSGKSTVAAIFAQLGIPIYEADLISKTIIDTDKNLQSKLKELLGNELVNENGRIDREHMASIIFKDTKLLEATNALIHPVIGEHFLNWYNDQDSAYVLKEAAILFESGSYKQCDKIVVVDAPEEMRIARVMKRSSVNRDQVLERMKNQMPQSEKLALADYVIYNNHGQSVIKQVIKAHEDLIQQSNTGS